MSKPTSNAKGQRLSNNDFLCFIEFPRIFAKEIKLNIRKNLCVWFFFAYRLFYFFFHFKYVTYAVCCDFSWFQFWRREKFFVVVVVYFIFDTKCCVCFKFLIKFVSYTFCCWRSFFIILFFCCENKIKISDRVSFMNIELFCNLLIFLS